MSSKVVTGIIRLERRHNQLRPGDVQRALAEWQAMSWHPRSLSLIDLGGCPCGCMLDHREVLEIAITSLAKRSARELRRIVDAADQQFLDRTLPNPWAGPDQPWWARRM